MGENSGHDSRTAELKPCYTTSEPDETVHVWQGRFGIRQGDYYGEGEGTLDLVWRSGPRIRFDIPALAPFGDVDGGRCDLSIPLLKAEAVGEVLEASIEAGEDGQFCGARGELQRNMVVGRGSAASHVIFHVVNFWPYLSPRPANAPPDYHIGRVVFEGEGWRITLQRVPGARELHKSLADNSGYGITHAGKAERIDGSPISPEEASELFDGLYSFLSFAKGSWSPPILYIGVADDGTRAWEDWSARPHATAWKVVATWFPEHEPECLARLFPGFMRIWSDPDRREILQSIIYWYVEANVSCGLEGGVIFCQTGLEKLAYHRMVHELGRMTEDDFQPRGKPAAERLRRFLTEFGLPTGIATNVRVQLLPGLAASRNWVDAPDALVQLRNSIIHPSKRNVERRANYPIDAQIEALTIGQWYFEVLLLKWFGFAGNYVNRQTIEWNGQTEALP